MSGSRAAEAGGRRLDWGLAAAVLVVQLLAVLNPELTLLDHEELYNAGHARLLQLEHLDAFLQLQYRSYCGGCTVNALIGAALFAGLGPSLLVWKLVPILFSVVAVRVGSAALREYVGTLAAVVFAGLFLLPPPAWQYLSLVGWGNHMEAGCVAVIAAVLSARLALDPSPRRAIGLGLVVGLGLWIGFSSGFVILAIGLPLLYRRDIRAIGLVALGALPVVGIWGLQAWSTQLSILDPIYYAGESWPDPRRIPEKLASLLAPRQLVALFGHPESMLGWVGGWAWAAVGGWALIRSGRAGALGRTAAGFLLAYLVVYSLVRFTVWAPPAPEIAPPGSMRYAAPLFPLLFLTIAAAVGRTWSEGRRVHAVLVLIPLVAVGLGARLTALSDPFPSMAALTMQGPDIPYLRDQAGYRLAAEVHESCTTSDPQAQNVHAYGLGWHQAQAGLEQTGVGPLAPLEPPADLPRKAYFEAVGGAVLTELDPDGQGGTRILVAARNRLRNQEPDGLTAALREVSWRRSEAWLGRIRGGRSHDTRTLGEIFASSKPLPEPAGDALEFSMGRRWATDLARWAKPSQIILPNHPAATPSFLEGLAFGLGSRWGPQTDLVKWWPLDTMPSAGALAAFQEGASSRWLIQTP